eukprot:jgi/Galph1/999/GphlegSOOS_G5800.1
MEPNQLEKRPSIENSQQLWKFSKQLEKLSKLHVQFGLADLIALEDCNHSATLFFIQTCSNIEKLQTKAEKLSQDSRDLQIAKERLYLLYEQAKSLDAVVSALEEYTVMLENHFYAHFEIVKNHHNTNS